MEWGQVLDRRQDYHMTVEGGGRECWLSATDGTFGGGMKGWRMIYRSPSKGREEQILIGVGRISSAALKIHTPQNKTQENKTPCFLHKSFIHAISPKPRNPQIMKEDDYDTHPNRLSPIPQIFHSLYPSQSSYPPAMIVIVWSTGPTPTGYPHHHVVESNVARVSQGTSAPRRQA